MNNFRNLQIALASMLLIAGACQNNQVTQVIPEEEKIIWINSYKVDCQGVAPMTCLQIQESDEIKFDAWLNFYSPIKGFEYEPGYLYRLKVKVSQREAPIPADASSIAYELLEILDKEPDLSLRITDIWKLIAIEGETVDSSQFSKALVFELHASQKSVFGFAGCNSLRGKIVELDESQIRFSEMASTMMACPDMETEIKVGELLKKVRSYEIGNLKLELKDASGTKLLTFQKVD